MSYGHDRDTVPVLKDSGDRRQFSTGAVRDRAIGKGRFDLLSSQMLFRLARHYEAGALLMIWGEKDVALTKRTTYGTERWVPNLTLHYLPDASHWVQQDDPEGVNRLIETWLEQQAARRSEEREGKA